MSQDSEVMVDCEEERACAPWISSVERLRLQRRIANNFSQLLFVHKKGAHCDGRSDEEEAWLIEQASFTATCDSEDADDVATMRRVYAWEAGRRLLAAVAERAAAASESDGDGDCSRVPPGLRRVATAMPEAALEPHVVWGWLVPGARTLPYVALKGRGIAIGQGRGALGPGPSSGSSIWPARLERKLAGLAFVEVADGRVSGLHCIVSLQWSEEGPVCCIEDCSTTGTFLNGVRIPQQQRVELFSGDRISLAPSAAPLAEQCFSFHEGARPSTAWSISAGPTGPHSPQSRSPARRAPAPGESLNLSLARTSTGGLSGADGSSLDDVRCQVCLGTPRRCVSIQPCGHNFCAGCLSHHFGSQMHAGLQLSCPFRCPEPERIVANYSARAAVDALLAQRPANLAARGSPSAASPSQPHHSPSTAATRAAPAGRGMLSPGDSAHSILGTSMSPGEQLHSGLPVEDEDDSCSPETAHANGRVHGDTASPPAMDLLCPLEEEMLPLEASLLRGRQLEYAVAQIKDTSLDPMEHQVSVEVLARLAWSDDSAREAVAQRGTVPAVVRIMRQQLACEALLCSCCLLLQALVRGDGDVCVANQWMLGKAGVVEAMLEVMRAWRSSAAVQLSVLLCLIPMTVDNAMVQAHISQDAFVEVAAAMDAHPGHAELQIKACVLLGVAVQGGDVAHDGIRQRLLEVGIPLRIRTMLQHHGASSTEALWAALFTLAVLMRDSSYVKNQVAHTVARVGLAPVLTDVLQRYRVLLEQGGVDADGDEMILAAGQHLLSVLGPLEEELRLQRLQQRQLLWAGGAVLVAAAAAVAILSWRAKRAAATS